ncbi:3-ketoacyl-CoA synthase [Seminavis robusta]|uniref:3-ketoacyl-CoA synthase n=1 Tax=Seminavis robusta TaxID=568900 RepID=A0A9N8DXZ9_9STRA|nr:3-ketoacyl-CoA synthase [Seminavis robusta]|eukprot:Sro357_g125520.1 3-ketoacyl-CoA synthase (566) ;mRNA; r:8549-10340
MAPRKSTEHLVDENVPTPAAVGDQSTMRRSGSESDFSVAGDANSRQYRVRKSSLIGMIDWTHVIGTQAPYLLFFGVVVLLAQILHQVLMDLGATTQQLSWETVSAVALALKELFIKLYASLFQNHHFFQLFSPAVKTTALALFVGAWMIRMDSPIYLLSFATFKAPDSWKLTHDEVVEVMRRQRCFTDESLAFLRRILERSGTGQATAWPPGIVQSLQDDENGDPVKSDSSMEASRKEAETVIFDVVEQALRKANVKPKEIDVLVINCSLFSPTPSLCAMVMSHFNMRPDVATYNLSGMGCSASLISIDLAKQLLGRHKYGKALVVSTEILTPNFYHGNDRGFLIQNTLFRCGGAAMVLSNNRWDGRRAWYKLLHTVRVQGAGQDAYNCVYETEDANGERGVRLSKDIVKVAGKTMEKNMTTLGPLVLPITEQAKVVVSIASRYIIKALSKTLTANGAESWAMKLPRVKPYVPDFKRGIDHFCVHAGGRAVIDGIEKNMKLENYHSEGSRMALLNYGNTSSSSIWYELEYIQDQQKSNPMKKGDRVMQVAFGSGFKCTSGVWLKL